MKRLLKLCVVAVVLVLGVSSCLKEDDSVNMSYLGNSVYVLQTENGKFIPQTRLFAERLVSASVKVEGKTFNFTDLNSYVWELTNNAYAPLPELDSIVGGYSVLTAKRDDGKIGNINIVLSAVNKKIGPFSASFQHSSDDKEFSVTFINLAENAEEYYLMIKVPISTESSSSYAMWLPYKNLDEIEEKNLSETVSYNDLGDGTYKIAVAAGYGSLFKIDENSIQDVTIRTKK